MNDYDEMEDEELANTLTELKGAMAGEAAVKEEFVETIDDLAGKLEQADEDIDNLEEQRDEYRELAISIAEDATSYLNGDASALEDLSDYTEDVDYNGPEVMYDLEEVEEAMKSMKGALSNHIGRFRNILEEEDSDE